jgi:hypothetical protein
MPKHDKHPTFEELSTEELIEILGLWPFAYCNAWERDFCVSLGQQLQRGRTLSERQIEILKKNLLYRLQDNDPHLWDLPRVVIDD